LAERLLAAIGRDGADAARALERAMIVLADHELNVSTFTARAAASTRADLYAAVAAALAAVQGPLHGGTLVGVAELLAAVPTAVEAEAYVQRRFAAAPTATPWLPGFGHPVYPTGDPRAPLLREIVADALGADDPRYAAARQIEEAVGRRGGPPANSDFYASVLF